MVHVHCKLSLLEMISRHAPMFTGSGVMMCVILLRSAGGHGDGGSARAINMDCSYNKYYNEEVWSTSVIKKCFLERVPSSHGFYRTKEATTNPLRLHDNNCTVPIHSTITSSIGLSSEGRGRRDARNNTACTYY